MEVVSLSNQILWLLASSNLLLFLTSFFIGKKLRRKNRKFKKLLDLVPCTISWISSDLKYVAVNKRLASMIGLKAEEFTGKNLGFREGDNDYQKFVKSIFSSTEEQVSFEFSVETRQGKRDILCIANKVDDGREATIIGVDITQQKQTEKSLVASARFATLGEMAGAIGHEINNPLTLIVNDNEELRIMLEEGTFDPTKANELIARIDRTSVRISKIVKGLKSFARDGSNDPFYLVEPQVIVEETLELCSQKFKANAVDLNIDISAGCSSFECQKVQVIQVLLNLLNNAFDAVKDSPQPWVKLEINSTDAAISFSVTDSGQRISDAIQKKIFQPFFTTKEIGIGTGMGLNISKGIVEKHRGTIYLDVKSSNTKFIVNIPLIQKLKKVS